MLERVATAAVPTPRVVAADPEAASCDVPALLMTRLPGHAPGLPRDPDAFLAQLAGALPAIHAVTPDALPAYERDHDLSAVDPPAWSRRPELRMRSIELVAAEPPPAAAVLIHRDYHPENTLWWRGRLTAPRVRARRPPGGRRRRLAGLRARPARAPPRARTGRLIPRPWVAESII